MGDTSARDWLRKVSLCARWELGGLRSRVRTLEVENASLRERISLLERVCEAADQYITNPLLGRELLFAALEAAIRTSGEGEDKP